MPRAKKGTKKVQFLKKTTGLCPSRNYYYAMMMLYRLDGSLDPYGTYRAQLPLLYLAISGAGVEHWKRNGMDWIIHM